MNKPGSVLERDTPDYDSREREVRPAAVFADDQPKRSLWWLWLLLFGALLYGGYRFYEMQVEKHAQMAAQKDAKLANRVPTVVDIAARTGDMPVTLRGLGTVTAFQTVTVKTRVDGQLTRVAFQEGQMVKKGDLLAEMDPRTYQVQVAQAEGQLARDQALLKDAQVNYKRNQALFDAQVIAKQVVETQGSLVGQYEGAIQADKAQVDAAKLQIAYCRILAPVSGRIGLRQVDQGNMLHANDTTGIAVITQMQPIAVLFSIPEDYLPRVMKRLRSNAPLPVAAFDRDGSEKLADGRLVTVDNQIDSTTGTSKMKAVFNNEDGSLFPNQFVNIEMHLDTRHNAVIVPAAAIQRGPSGTFVYAISNGKANVRPVTTGALLVNDIAIEKDCKAGNVVVDGADKLTDGMAVEAHEISPTAVHIEGKQGNRS